MFGSCFRTSFFKTKFRMWTFHRLPICSPSWSPVKTVRACFSFDNFDSHVLFLNLLGHQLGVKVGKKIVAVFPTLSKLYPRVCPRFAHGSCLISNGIYIYNGTEPWHISGAKKIIQQRLGNFPQPGDFEHPNSKWLGDL